MAKTLIGNTTKKSANNVPMKTWNQGFTSEGGTVKGTAKITAPDLDTILKKAGIPADVTSRITQAYIAGVNISGMQAGRMARENVTFNLLDSEGRKDSLAGSLQSIFSLHRKGLLTETETESKVQGLGFKSMQSGKEYLEAHKAKGKTESKKTGKGETGKVTARTKSGK